MCWLREQILVRTSPRRSAGGWPRRRCRRSWESCDCFQTRKMAGVGTKIRMLPYEIALRSV